MSLDEVRALGLCGALLAGAGLTSGALAAPDGAALYVRHCSVCHGDAGDGSMGVPLSLPGFQATVDDEYLRRTIRYGRPGRVMPAFPALSDAQLEALVRHLRGWATGPAPAYDPTPVNGDRIRGAELYGEYCAVCHGVDGEGGRGTGVTFSRPRYLPIVAPALSNPGFLASASDRLIQRTLVQGREGTSMKSFDALGLDRSQIDDIVVFVRGFEPGEPGEPEPSGDAREPLRFSRASPYSLDETVDNVVQAIVSMNFRHIRTQPFEQGLVAEDAEDRRTIMIYFCNFDLLNDTLAVDPRIGYFLPYRITVSQRGDKVAVSALNPVIMGERYNNAELTTKHRQLRDMYRALIEEATL